MCSKPAPSTETYEYSIRVVQWAALGVQVLVHVTPGIFHKVDVASHAGGAVAGVIGAWLLKDKVGRKIEAVTVKPSESTF